MNMDDTLKNEALMF